MLSHRRHDITDRVWLKLEPHLPGRKGSWGGIAKDNRTFINAVFWVLRTGSPWRDLPPDYGHWSNVLSMSIKNVPVICTKSVPVIIKNFTSFFLRVFKFFHTITFSLNIEDRCVMH